MSLRDASDLSKTLRQIDGRGYKAYKQLTGAYGFDTWTLFIDHVQGDPFAAPSKMRLRLAQSVAEIPPHLFDNRVRRLALEDFLGRAVSMVIPRGTRRGTGKSGLITIDAGAQEVLERTAVVVTPEWVEARIELGLPAAGRTISGRQRGRAPAQRAPEDRRRLAALAKPRQKPGDSFRRHGRELRALAHSARREKARGFRRRRCGLAARKRRLRLPDARRGSLPGP